MSAMVIRTTISLIAPPIPEIKPPPIKSPTVYVSAYQVHDANWRATLNNIIHHRAAHTGAVWNAIINAINYNLIS